MKSIGLFASIGLFYALGMSHALAQEHDFYAGKQIQFIIRSEAGSSYDQYSRLLGKYMSTHIAGNPTIIPVNMPGSGGLAAANYVAVKAPKDGTILTMVGQGLPTDQALGLNKSLQADLNAFNWIGNVDWSNQLVITWHTSSVRTLADAIAHKSTFGSAGAGSISTQVPAMMNSLAGTQFKVVLGYPGPGDLLLAMERGEVDNTLFTWASIKSLRPDYITKHLINIVTQVGLKKDVELPDVPLMRDLARNSTDQATLDYLAKSVAVGRPVATTSGVPVERVRILRKAFDDSLKDPEFIKEAEAQNLEIMGMSGEDLQQIVKDLIEAPPDLLARVRQAIQVTP